MSGFTSPDAHAQRLEALWYVRGEQSIQAFLKHADQISIVAPQVYTMDSTGIIRGQVDPRVIETARAKRVKLMPLVMNPGFDQPTIHRVLTDPTARAQALRSLATLCRANRFDGILENFHVSDKDAFTSFTREAVDSVHRAGCKLSAAVVPRLGGSGHEQLRPVDPRQLARRVRLQGARGYARSSLQRLAFGFHETAGPAQVEQQVGVRDVEDLFLLVPVDNALVRESV